MGWLTWRLSYQTLSFRGIPSSHVHAWFLNHAGQRACGPQASIWYIQGVQWEVQWPCSPWQSRGMIWLFVVVCVQVGFRRSSCCIEDCNDCAHSMHGHLHDACQIPLITLLCITRPIIHNLRLNRIIVIHESICIAIRIIVKVILKWYQIWRALASARTLCPFPEYIPVFQKAIHIVSEDTDGYGSVSEGLDNYCMISRCRDKYCIPIRR